MSAIPHLKIAKAFSDSGQPVDHPGWKSQPDIFRNRYIMTLTSENFNLYAAMSYDNPTCLSSDDFYDDLTRFKYIKKILTQYEKSGEIQDRLLLNHLIVIHNVFKSPASTQMCFFKVKPKFWPTLKTFLLYLKLIHPDDFPTISIDLNLVPKLQNL